MQSTSNSTRLGSSPSLQSPSREATRSGPWTRSSARAFPRYIILHLARRFSARSIPRTLERRTSSKSNILSRVAELPGQSIYMVKYSSRLGDIPPLSPGNSVAKASYSAGWVAGHFAEGDTLPKDILPKDILPNGHFKGSLKPSKFL